MKTGNLTLIVVTALLFIPELSCKRSGGDQVGQDRAEKAKVSEVRIEADGLPDSTKWTSARLTTRGKTSFIYGKMEFRAKVPVERGNWAAGWTLGDAYVDELSWPYCGEIWGGAQGMDDRVNIQRIVIDYVRIYELK
jgi:beta-glucanase (GH16 family)